MTLSTKISVDVVVNQKVVSVDAQQIFKSKGIMIFERLGLNWLRRISKMSNVKMILQNLSQKFHPEDLIGTLDDTFDTLKHLVQFHRPIFIMPRIALPKQIIILIKNDLV